MSNAPINLSVIEQRISAQVTDLVHVGGAADYAAVEELRRFRTPSVFVVPIKETVTNTQAQNTHQVFSQFGVIIAVQSYRGTTGKAAMLDANPIIGAVRTALVGWSPASREFYECMLLEGELLDYDKSALLWADVFQTSFFIERN